MKYLSLLAALAATAPAVAADIRLVPGDGIVANRANPGRGYSDMLVQSIAVATGPDERLTILDLRIELLDHGTPVLAETVGGDRLVHDTADLMSAPIPAFVSGQLLNREGLPGLFGHPVRAGTSGDLGPSQALVTTRHYFAFRGPVDSLRVVLHARRPDGTEVTAERTIPVAEYRSPIAYHLPLRGAWLLQGVPSLQSHHRFNASTEFALDFFKVDGEGRLGPGGNAARAANAYGYGEEVLAAADGEVVRVIDGEVQDRAAFTRRPDETPQAAGQRIEAFMMERMNRDFERALAGNFIVLRHRSGDVVEYSTYGHLRTGIAVHVGEQVRQGQVIGHVGDTGDSPTVHLHFQLNTAPDPFNSKSLPARFEGLRATMDNSDLGRFVVAPQAGEAH